MEVLIGNLNKRFYLIASELRVSKCTRWYSNFSFYISIAEYLSTRIIHY
jgi:hypothetical protein